MMRWWIGSFVGALLLAAAMFPGKRPASVQYMDQYGGPITKEEYDRVISLRAKRQAELDQVRLDDAKRNAAIPPVLPPAGPAALDSRGLGQTVLPSAGAAALGLPNLRKEWPTGDRCAENGSCYGDLSDRTGRPKTSYVEGYTRKDGKYVRGYYKSQPRRRR